MAAVVTACFLAISASSDSSNLSTSDNAPAIERCSFQRRQSYFNGSKGLFSDFQESGADSLLDQPRLEGKDEVVQKLVVRLFGADERFESLVRANRKRCDLDFSDGRAAAQQERTSREQTRPAIGQSFFGNFSCCFR